MYLVGRQRGKFYNPEVFELNNQHLRRCTVANVLGLNKDYICMYIVIYIWMALNMYAPCTLQIEQHII